MKKRCTWCTADPLYIAYHDEEWGVPVHDDIKLFEMLILEGAQAGLSWITILKKRADYRRALDSFDFCRIANYTEKDVDRLAADPGIIRNRLKIHSAIQNARGALRIIDEFGSLNSYFWRYVDGQTQQNNLQPGGDMPSSTSLSVSMGKDLKKRGFSFVGPTICYAFMQSVGLVNDHSVDCFRHKELCKMV